MRFVGDVHFVLWDVISVSLPGIETSVSAAGSQGCTAVTFQMQTDLLLMSLLWSEVSGGET